MLLWIPIHCLLNEIKLVKFRSIQRLNFIKKNLKVNMAHLEIQANIDGKIQQVEIPQYSLR